MNRGQSSGAGTSFARGLVVGAIVLFLLLLLIEPMREALLPATGEERTAEAQRIIEDSYFRTTTDEELENGSINGMVEKLRKENEDRFSHFFDAETYERFTQATSGEFSGIGLAVSEVREGLRVSQVYEGAPAEKAGIEVGELITAVEGKSIAGESATASSAKIKGPPGTEVEITVEDPESGKSRDLTVERDAIRIPAVSGRMLERDGEKIGYVQLETFSSGVHGELRSEIERLSERGAEGLVFDLRGNGGGLLQEAILVGSIFVEDGPIVITEGRTRPRQEYTAEGDALAPVPTVVLTNRDTASASEIVAAALQQNDLGEIVGTRTYGKGTFQEVIELEGGGALDLTVGEYLTADGSSILGEGVKPDVAVADDERRAGDEQLDRGAAIVAREIAASGAPGSATGNGN